MEVIDLILERGAPLVNSRRYGNLMGYLSYNVAYVLKVIAAKSGAISFRNLRKWEIDLVKLRVYRENMGDE